MRIGFDAKYYFDPPSSGRVWTREVMHRLAAGWPQHHWTWFLKNRDRARAAEIPPGHDSVFASFGWNLLSNALVLPRHVARRQLDVLVTQYFAAPTATPQVAVIHDIIFEPHPELFTRRERAYLGMIKPLLRWANTVVTVSEASHEQLQQYGYLRPGQRCVVIPNGVNDRFFNEIDGKSIDRVRSRYDLPARYLLYVGRLNARKNLPRLIESVTRLRDQEIGLVLAGRSEGAAEDYAGFARKLGIEHRVRFLGSVPDEDLHPLYSAATAFVYLSKREGFGLPPLEAMAAEIPVVVSNEPALKEVGGDVPLYVNPEDGGDVVRTLDRVIENRDLRQERAALGRARARLFTWDRTVDALAKVLESTAAAHR